ncbi:MAG: hypothetical protein ABJK59_02020 [Erythrobacter sp.]|uniref:hypothetical protein n=1 Tax=Erythrobacter sp. TaxID=1042 RepID=UPI003298A0F0
MASSKPKHPEPVPEATQLAVMPFLAAVEGYLIEGNQDCGLRLTVHRLMAREKHRHIQQICTYFGGAKDERSAGRLFSAQTGLMGLALEKKKICHTKHYDNVNLFEQEIRADRIDAGEGGDNQGRAQSFLAIPFIGEDSEVVLILYAESTQFNFFANEEKVSTIANMCQSFCDLADWIVEQVPRSSLRNFETKKLDFKVGHQTAFRRINAHPDIVAPSFNHLRSFNLETI